MVSLTTNLLCRLREGRDGDRYIKKCSEILKCEYKKTEEETRRMIVEKIIMEQTDRGGRVEQSVNDGK